MSAPRKAEITIPMRLFFRLPVTVLGELNKTPVPIARPMPSASKRYPVKIGITIPVVISIALAKSVLFIKLRIFALYSFKFNGPCFKGVSLPDDRVNLF